MHSNEGFTPVWNALHFLSECETTRNSHTLNLTTNKYEKVKLAQLYLLNKVFGLKKKRSSNTCGQKRCGLKIITNYNLEKNLQVLTYTVL